MVGKRFEKLSFPGFIYIENDYVWRIDGFEVAVTFEEIY